MTIFGVFSTFAILSIVLVLRIQPRENHADLKPPTS